MHRTPGDSTRSLRGLHAALVAGTLLAGAWGVRAATAPARRPENPHGTFRENCAMCHRAEAWKPARVSRAFDHSKYGFPLTGAHAAAACTDCHATLEFRQHAMSCAGCHEDVHRGELGADCSRCHSARSFLDLTAARRLHQSTRFPLTGGHAGLDCEQCHRPAAAGRMQFVGTRAACVDCHLADYRAATNPDHGAGFSTECALCHSPLGWRGARFDHAASRFPLTGAHRAAACNACHGDGVYAGKSTLCVSCHQADYDAATNPRHTLPSYPTACQNCHGTSSWAGGAFDHASTAFPLTGAHATVACNACHGDGVYAGKRTDCASCHQADYNATTNPAHVAAGFPTTCATCHSTTTWAGATFDHDVPYFRIYSGRHRGLWSSCSDCHNNPASYAQFDCLSCHPHDDKAATDSKHTGRAGYSYTSSACYSCHRGS